VASNHGVLRIGRNWELGEEMKVSFWVCVLWVITGYINGYNDRDDHSHKGLAFISVLLMVCIVIYLIGSMK